MGRNDNTHFAAHACILAPLHVPDAKPDTINSSSALYAATMGQPAAATSRYIRIPCALYDPCPLPLGEWTLRVLACLGRNSFTPQSIVHAPWPFGYCMRVRQLAIKRSPGRTLRMQFACLYGARLCLHLGTYGALEGRAHKLERALFFKKRRPSLGVLFIFGAGVLLEVFFLLENDFGGGSLCGATRT